jgi:hypothetical protein
MSQSDRARNLTTLWFDGANNLGMTTGLHSLTYTFQFNPSDSIIGKRCRMKPACCAVDAPTLGTELNLFTVTLAGLSVPYAQKSTYATTATGIVSEFTERECVLGIYKVGSYDSWQPLSYLVNVPVTPTEIKVTITRQSSAAATAADLRLLLGLEFEPIE